MNRREAITGSAAAAVVGLWPGTNIRAEEDLSLEKGESQVSLTTTSVVDDPDVEQIRVTAILKKGKTVKGSDSFLIERALLKHVGTNLIPWFQYCRENSMKTF